MEKIKTNKFLTIIVAIVLGFFIFRFSNVLANKSISLFENKFELSFYTENVVMKLYMLIMSIIVILLINKGSLKNYGFRGTKNFNYFRMSWVTILITLITFIVGGIIFLGILSHLFPMENNKSLPKPSSLIEMVLTVWIWSSLCEEVLVRGLVQGFIGHLKQKVFWKISLSVLVSGLFFGSMHLFLLNAGMGVWFVGLIFFNTTIIGLLAAYYREKSESLIPPFLVHFLANVVLSIPLIIATLFEIKIS